MPEQPGTSLPAKAGPDIHFTLRIKFRRPRATDRGTLRRVRLHPATSLKYEHPAQCPHR